MFNVPVALIIFNRPDTTARVVAALRTVQPTRLFVIADGPRPTHPADGAACRSTRAIIDTIDWPCEVRTDYAATNMGCGRRVASGLAWLFEQADEAIILEDDCLPDASFFPFCRDLLARYRDDERVMMISGTNPMGEWQSVSQSYFFSLYGMHWGWATWRRAWRHYDFEMRQLEAPDTPARLLEVTGNAEHAAHRLRLARHVAKRNFTTWDSQWTFSQLLQAGLSVVPAFNLITNIGFDHRATHTHTPIRLGARLPRQALTFPLHHPPQVEADVTYDAQFMSWHMGHPPIHLVLTQAAQHVADGHPIQALLLLEAALRSDLSMTQPEHDRHAALKAQAQAAAIHRRHEVQP